MIVSNRKLFKKRPARDNLNQVAGIMASSPELMNEVQRFQSGGPVILGSNAEALIASQQDPTNTFLGSEIFRTLDKEMGYPIYKAGKILGFQSEPPLARTITRTEVPENIRTTPFNVTEGQLSAISNVDPFAGYDKSIRDLIENPTKFGGEVGQKIEEFLENVVIGSTKGIAGLTNRSLEELSKYDPSYLKELSETILEQTPEGIDLADIPGSGVGRTVDGNQVFQPGVVTQTGYGKTKGQPPSQEVYDMLGINEPIGPAIPRDEINEIINRSRETAKKQEIDRFKEIDRESVKKAEQLAAREGEKEAAVADLLQEAQDKEVFDYLQGQKQKEFRKSEDQMRQDKQFFESPASDEATKEIIKQETDNIIKETTGSDLKTLMKEFVDNAPKYEGMNQGMAIAKIGFAIAAGESPNALVNIAKGLEMGADMFIKDKKDRDEFQRQIQLAGLQYGLGEISKEKAEQRIINRSRLESVDYTFGPEGGEYRGKKYGPYSTVPIMRGDIIDNNIPDGLIDSAVITALNSKNKAFEGLMKDMVMDKVLTAKEEENAQTAYNDAVGNAIKAERGIELVDKTLLTVAEGGVTGLGPAVETIYAKAKRFIGAEDKITSLESARSLMRRLLQGIVPVTLAKDQSANSISNRDIDFLITAFFGDGALDPGSFNFVLTSREDLISKLQAAGVAMQEAQMNDFNTMSAIEIRLKDKYMKGTLALTNEGVLAGQSALGLLSPAQQRLEQANLTRIYEGQSVGGSGNIGSSSGINWSRGDDGLINIQLPGG